MNLFVLKIYSEILKFPRQVRVHKALGGGIIKLRELDRVAHLSLRPSSALISLNKVSQRTVKRGK